MKKIALFTICFCGVSFVSVDAQILKNLEKKVERKVNQRIERKTDRAIEKGLDTVEEAIDGKNEKQDKQVEGNVSDNKSAPNSGSISPDVNTGGKKDEEQRSGFVNRQKDPELNFSGEVIFSDDFVQTDLGALPGKITSSSGGEVVSVNGIKGFRFFPNSNVLLKTSGLPKNFALEFDLTLNNVPPSLYNTFFNVYLQSLKVLKHNDPKNQFGAIGFSLWGSNDDHKINVFNHKAAFEIEEDIPYNINANLINKTAKFLIIRHKDRLRLFINEEKITDSPALLEGVPVNYINFRLNGTKKEDNRNFIVSNVKVTVIGEDLRSQWENEGKFSTTEIYFATGSAQIEEKSEQILEQIAAVLNGDKSANIEIIGHTDNVGSDESNRRLSEQRATSVKEYLNKNFKIDSSRMSTSGKGALQPVAGNNTDEGKARNRRVEFVRK